MDFNRIDVRSNENNVQVTVHEMASRREMRAKRQNELIHKYGLPIICFTMNIAGPVKRSPLIEWGFNMGALTIKQVFKDSIEFYEFVREKTGCEAFFVINSEAEEIKSLMIMIEETQPLGRFFDIDVIGTDGVKLSRGGLRKCIVCGNAAIVCARSRAHSVDELSYVTKKAFGKALCEKLGQLAYEALYEEVHATPKPGLVDENNSGANSDMDIFLFEKSMETLKPYFVRMAEHSIKNFISDEEKGMISNGAAFCEGSFIKETMGRLQKIGLEAEQAMLETTCGVNTHRGAIYSLGLIVSACAIANTLGAEGFAYNSRGESSLVRLVAKLAKAQVYDRNERSNGASVRKIYGVGGAREEAFSGFPLARLAKSIKKEYYTKCIDASASETMEKVNPWIYALLAIMHRLDDNNALRRGGKDGADFVKQRAGELLLKCEKLKVSDLIAFDNELIERNISCGGAADMLAAAMLLEKIENFELI